METTQIRAGISLIRFDELGGFCIADGIIELINAEPEMVAGGFLDGGCGGNGACFNTYNTYCVNTNLCNTDTGCLTNAVCVA